jgi:hypothetical protein
VQAIKEFSQAEANLRGGWQPQLPLELALVESVMGQSGESSPSQPVTRGAPNVQDAAADYRVNPDPVIVPAEKGSEVPEQEQSDPAARDQSVVSGGLALDAVRQCWPQVLENARARDRSVQALLNSTLPGDVRQGVVTLHVAHEFARGKLSQGRAKRLVEELLSQALGQSCQVEYMVVTPSSAVSSAEAISIEAPLRGGELGEKPDAWADDPLVQAARQMGAEVRPIDEGREK